VARHHLHLDGHLFEGNRGQGLFDFLDLFVVRLAGVFAGRVIGGHGKGNAGGVRLDMGRGRGGRCYFAPFVLGGLCSWARNDTDYQPAEDNKSGVSRSLDHGIASTQWVNVADSSCRRTMPAALLQHFLCD
jgi:hypothetical protein